MLTFLMLSIFFNTSASNKKQPTSTNLSTIVSKEQNPVANVNKLPNKKIIRQSSKSIKKLPHKSTTIKRKILVKTPALPLDNVLIKPTEIQKEKELMKEIMGESTALYGELVFEVYENINNIQYLINDHFIANTNIKSDISNIYSVFNTKMLVLINKNSHNEEDVKEALIYCDNFAESIKDVLNKASNSNLDYSNLEKRIQKLEQSDKPKITSDQIMDLDMKKHIIALQNQIEKQDKIIKDVKNFLKDIDSQMKVLKNENPIKQISLSHMIDRILILENNYAQIEHIITGVASILTNDYLIEIKNLMQSVLLIFKQIKNHKKQEPEGNTRGI